MDTFANLEIIYPKCALLETKSGPFFHKFPGKTLHGANLFGGSGANAHHIRQMEFGDLPQIWK